MNHSFSLDMEEREVRFANSKKKKRIKHYSSNQKILLVGEGNFSFAACLAKRFGSAENLVATSLDSKKSVMAKYSNAAPINLKKLEDGGCVILHGVDVHTMTQHHRLVSHLFDRVVFNFPHAGFIHKEIQKRQIELHQHLVRGFFASACQMLKANGEVHVTHKTSHPFSEWEIVKLAEEAGLYLIEEAPFSTKHYPGYVNMRGSGNRCNKTFPVGQCSTYKFAKLQLRKPRRPPKTAHTNPISVFGSSCPSIPIAPVAPYSTGNISAAFLYETASPETVPSSYPNTEPICPKLPLQETLQDFRNQSDTDWSLMGTKQPPQEFTKLQLREPMSPPKTAHTSPISMFGSSCPSIPTAPAAPYSGKISAAFRHETASPETVLSSYPNIEPICPKQPLQETLQDFRNQSDTDWSLMGTMQPLQEFAKLQLRDREPMSPPKTAHTNPISVFGSSCPSIPTAPAAPYSGKISAAFGQETASPETVPSSYPNTEPICPKKPLQEFSFTTIYDYFKKIIGQ